MDREKVQGIANVVVGYAEKITATLTDEKNPQACLIPTIQTNLDRMKLAIFAGVLLPGGEDYEPTDEERTQGAELVTVLLSSALMAAGGLLLVLESSPAPVELLTELLSDGEVIKV